MNTATPSGADALPAKPPGIDALQCVIAGLRDTACFVDEEGELTNDLCALRDWACSRSALSAAQEAPAQAAETDSEAVTWQELEDFRKRHWSHWNASDNLLIAHLVQTLRTAPAQAVQAVPLSDAQIDYMLSAVVPGGSSARDWFLPHETDKGLRNVRDVVRAMLAAAPAAPQPAGQEIDWKDQYEKQKRRAEMWIAKYEKDIGPLEMVVPAAQEPSADALDAKCTCLTGQLGPHYCERCSP